MQTKDIHNVHGSGDKLFPLSFLYSTLMPEKKGGASQFFLAKGRAKSAPCFGAVFLDAPTKKQTK